MNLIKKRPFAHVYVDPKANAMVHQWQQQIDADTYQEMVSDMLETFADLKQDYPGLGWICDNTKTPNVACASRFWKDNILDEELLSVGLQHVAIVVDRRSYDSLEEKTYTRPLQPAKGQLAVEEEEEEVEDNSGLKQSNLLQVQYFGDMVAAQSWLASNAKQAVA